MPARELSFNYEPVNLLRGFNPFMTRRGGVKVGHSDGRLRVEGKRKI